MSDYKRGKGMVHAWAIHWDAIANVADANTTVEAKLIEYGQPIREAFTHAHVPELLMIPMPDYVRVAHRYIMELPIEQREVMLVWHFGDDGERNDMFGRSDREPAKMGAIYKKIGRRWGRSRRRKKTKGNVNIIKGLCDGLRKFQNDPPKNDHN